MLQDNQKQRFLKHEIKMRKNIALQVSHPCWKARHVQCRMAFLPGELHSHHFHPLNRLRPIEIKQVDLSGEKISYKISRIAI